MSADQIRSSFDPESMEGDNVYVIPDDAECLVPLFGQLRDFYIDAASKGNGMLIYLSRSAAAANGEEPDGPSWTNRHGCSGGAGVWRGTA